MKLDPFIKTVDGLPYRRRLLVAFLTGALGVLAQAPFHLWPVMFISWPVLVLLLDGLVAQAGTDERALFKSAFWLGWAFGFGHFLFGLYWIGKAFMVEAGVYIVLMPFAMTLMPAGLALFYALAVALAALFWQKGFARVLVLALFLGLAEWLRGHVLTGFPWNTPGHVFLGEAGLSQLSCLFGPYALSFIAVLLFSAPAIGLMNKSLHYRPAITALAALAVISALGHLRLYNAAKENHAGIRLRLVQPNIAQIDKWRPGNAGPIYRKMLKLSSLASDRAPHGLQDVTHLIWPETALPFFMARSQQALKGIAQLLPEKTSLITGAIRYEDRKNSDKNPQRVVFNSLLVLDDKARIMRRFDKKHLVPFGEYLPLSSIMERLGLHQLVAVRGQFETGQQARLVDLPDAPAFAPLICYEVAFAEQIIDSSRRPQWLLNVTNDGWYGISTGPYQHLQQARMRAIEQGLPMVRVANTGISAIIDPYGRILQSLPLATKGLIDSPLPRAIAPPLYARYGRSLFWLIMLAAICLVLYTQKTCT